MTRFSPLAVARAGTLPALLLLAACDVPNDVTDPQTGYPKDLPEAVIELADPSQDLTTAWLNPDDGCYWYRYEGPVESTMLPLRTREGRPICTRPAEG